MVGESGTSHTMQVHRYYKCVTAKKRRDCNKKSIKKDWIEDIVIEQAVKLLNDDAVLEKLAGMVIELQKRENTAIPLLRKQLAEAERGIENMLNAIQQGILTPSTRKQLDDLEAAKSDLEVQILQEEMQKPILTKEQVLFWLYKFRGIDTTDCSQRQRLIDTFVNAVYLYDDKIVLTFNYKDGAKTIEIRLMIRFNNGERRVYDFAPNLLHPFYTPLLDLDAFQKVNIIDGEIVWASGQDFCPHTLYEQSVPVGST